jgi:hypothetical protein
LRLPSAAVSGPRQALQHTSCLCCIASTSPYPYHCLHNCHVLRHVYVYLCDGCGLDLSGTSMDRTGRPEHPLRCRPHIISTPGRGSLRVLLPCGRIGAGGGMDRPATRPWSCPNKPARRGVATCICLPLRGVWARLVRDIHGLGREARTPTTPSTAHHIYPGPRITTRLQIHPEAPPAVRPIWGRGWGRSEGDA